MAFLRNCLAGPPGLLAKDMSEKSLDSKTFESVGDVRCGVGGPGTGGNADTVSISGFAKNFKHVGDQSLAS